MLSICAFQLFFIVATCAPQAIASFQSLCGAEDGGIAKAVESIDFNRLAADGVTKHVQQMTGQPIEDWISASLVQARLCIDVQSIPSKEDESLQPEDAV
jgi:hypothetical protein